MIERKYFTLIYEQPITVEAWKRKCVELPKEKTIARCEVIFNADDELSTEAQAEKKMCEQTADRLERTVLLCNSIFNTEVSLPARVDSARRLCEHPKDVVVNTWQPTFFNRFCSWLTTGNGLQKIADSESPVNVNSVNMNL